MTAAASTRVHDPLAEPRARGDRFHVPGNTPEANGWGEKPPPSAPRYVHACHREENHLLLWPLAGGVPTGGVEAIRVPARCGSWRHGGPCQRKRAAQDFARIRAAFEPFDPSDLVVLVLTLDQAATRAGAAFTDRNDVFTQPRSAREKGEPRRDLAGMWTRLRKRIDYHLAKAGHEPIGSRWCMVVEQHRSGWPHVNVMVVCPELARISRRQYHRARETGRTHKQSCWVADGFGLELRHHTVASGFGPVSSSEPVRSRDAIAGYFVGLSSDPLDIDPSAGEIAKYLQVPTAAPRGFRRLRAGVRFLPKRFKRGTHTGVLVNGVRNTIVTRAPKTIEAKKRSALWGLMIDVWRGVVFRRDDLVSLGELPPVLILPGET